MSKKDAIIAIAFSAKESISVTLNTYTHVQFDDARAEFDRCGQA